MSDIICSMSLNLFEKSIFQFSTSLLLLLQRVARCRSSLCGDVVKEKKRKKTGSVGKLVVHDAKVSRVLRNQDCF